MNPTTLKERDMKEATPTLSISLNVHCPLCKQYVNLLENNDLLEELFSTTVPWADHLPTIERTVTCPDCKGEFILDGVYW